MWLEVHPNVQSAGIELGSSGVIPIEVSFASPKKSQSFQKDVVYIPFEGEVILRVSTTL